jgi:hypothetical protein
VSKDKPDIRIPKPDPITGRDSPGIPYEGLSLVRKTTDYQMNLVPFSDTSSWGGRPRPRRAPWPGWAQAHLARPNEPSKSLKTMDRICARASILGKSPPQIRF